jgi:hypothetical protein
MNGAGKIVMEASMILQFIDRLHEDLHVTFEELQPRGCTTY